MSQSDSDTHRRLRVATRGSALALRQTELVVEAIREHHDIACDIVRVVTTGDALPDRSIVAIGGDGVFVKELMAALIDGRADIAVHSLKDLPTEIPAAVNAGVVIERDDARDALISIDNQYSGIEQLPPNASVGTSSLRRSAQLRALRPDLRVQPLRGNVDTRVRKVLAGDYDAAVLAYAGLKRIHLLAKVGGASPLAQDIMVPAVGQGALFVQCRAEDAATRSLLSAIHHAPTAFATSLERAFLRRIGGGCLAPVGAYAYTAPERWFLTACIASTDGTAIMKRTVAGPMKDAAEALAEVENCADAMLSEGGAAIIGQLRGSGV